MKVAAADLPRGQPLPRRQARARRAAAELEDGDTIPVSQTSAPVQIDQVLGTLKTDTRKDLQKLLMGYGEALNGEPEPGEDDDQDPDAQGETGARGAERLARLLGRRAARRGDREPGDARHRAARPLEADRRPAEDHRRAVEPRGAAQGPDHELQHHDGRARAPRRTNLRETIRAAARGARGGQPALDNLNAAFPSTRAWALEMIPGVRETPATIEAGFPWVAPDARAALAERAAGPRGRPAARRRRLRPVRGRPGASSCRCSTCSTAASSRSCCPSGEHAHRGRPAHDRRAELPGVPPDAGGPRRRSRRTSTATARTRASSPAAARSRSRRGSVGDARPALRQRDRPAARHPPGARAQAALPAPTSQCHRNPVPDLNSARSDRDREAADQEAGARVRGDPVPVRVAGRDRRLHPVAPALLPARLGAGARDRLLRGRGRAADRPGGRAGPGPDGERGRREGRRGRRGDARGRPRRREHADQGRVQADLPRRHDPAAAQDRPEGHVPGARPRHAGGRRAGGGRPRAGGQHAARRERRRGARAARRRHARLPAHPAERRRHGVRRRGDGGAEEYARAPRRTCARSSSASSRPPATAGGSRAR